MRDGDKTVREDQATVSEGQATVREGQFSAQEGGATVREGSGPTQSGGATVREDQFTIREDGATVREGLGESGPSVAPSQEHVVAGWLPPSLAADFRIAKSLPALGGQADLFVLEPRNISPNSVGGSRRVAKVYREGHGPKEDVVRLVQSANIAHVVHLEAYGREAGRWWELMEYVERGSLTDLIEQEGPKLAPDLIRDILVELNEALAGVHELPMEHRDLKPANVLVRSRNPLDLIITDFGISSLMDVSHHMTTAARTIVYAPPESLGTMDRSTRQSMVMIEHTKWDYWSLGMMLVEMLQGKHPFWKLSEVAINTELMTQSVDQLTKGISDPDWRKLCRGLLRRAPSDRWGAEEVSKWLVNSSDTSLAVAADTTAASASTQAPPRATITFDGARYATTMELGEALSRDWTKAGSFWKRRFSDVQTWVIDGLGLGDLGDALADIDESEVPLDSQIFSFIYLLAPNAPLRFRDFDLSMDGLVALGERAVNQGDAEAGTSLLVLNHQRILAIAGSMPGQEDLAEVQRRWNKAVADYGRNRDKLRERGVEVPELGGDLLIRLLSASIPGSPLEVQLRVGAHKEVTGDVRRCDWLRELGTPEEMSITTLCMLPHLLEPARSQGRLARWRPIRGCVAGIVIGFLFGELVVWANRAYSQGQSFDSFVGAVSLTLLIFAFLIAIPWHREGFRGVLDWLGSFFGAIAEFVSGLLSGSDSDEVGDATRWRRWQQSERYRAGRGHHRGGDGGRWGRW